MLLFYFTETESIYDKVITEIAQMFGKDYPDGVKLKILGRTERDTAKVVVESLILPLTQNEFLDIYRKKCIEYFNNIQFMPGAKELVHFLHEHNIPIAVATSSSQQEMKLKTKDLMNTFKLFHHIVCGSTDPDVKRGKPAPDIFLTCASRFPDNPDPSKVICLT